MGARTPMVDKSVVTDLDYLHGKALARRRASPLL
jgi:hypothetical protein